MKRHVAAVVVALTAWLVIDSHVDWVPQDGKRLLEVSGQRWDLRGWAAEQLLQLRRDCTPVSRWPPDSPTARAVLPVIQQHSLPDSQSARWLQQLQPACKTRRCGAARPRLGTAATLCAVTCASKRPICRRRCSIACRSTRRVMAQVPAAWGRFQPSGQGHDLPRRLV